MTTRLSSREVDDRAAAWAAKVDTGLLGPDEQAALDAWLDEDARHFGAFAKARAVLAHTDRARALGPEFDVAQFGAIQAPSRRRFMLTGSIAAGLAAMAVGAEVFSRLLGARKYTTRIGETQIVPLEDGSILTLNTHSQVEVNYTKDRRDIRLLRGEVLFDVAKNKQRPFVVEAAGTTVRAVGTSFTVSLLPDRPVQVLVREGIVEVKRPSVPVAPPVRLAANNRAVAPVDAPIQTAAVAPAEVTRALSWRVGRLAFEGESLRDAAAAFARYSDTHIEIDDPAIANQSVTGLFVSNDPVGFSKAVALSLGLHAEVSDNAVRLSR